MGPNLHEVGSNNRTINTAIQKNKKMFANFELWLMAGEIDDPDLLKYLIDSKSADVNFTDELGYTPLMHALFKERIENVRYLLSVGADIFIHTKTGDTVFSIAETQGLDFDNLLEKNLIMQVFCTMNNIFPKIEEPDNLNEDWKKDICKRLKSSYAKFLCQKKNKKTLGNNSYEINHSSPLKNGYTRVDVEGKDIAIKDEILEPALLALDPLDTFLLKIYACISQLENEESEEVFETEEYLEGKEEEDEISSEDDSVSEEGKEKDEVDGKEKSSEKEERANKSLDYRQKNMFLNIIETLALEGGDLKTEAKTALKAFLIDSTCINKEDLTTIAQIRQKLFHMPLKILTTNNINSFFKQPWKDVSKFFVTYLKRIYHICKTDQKPVEAYYSLQIILQVLDKTKEENLLDWTEDSMESYLQEIISSSYDDNITEETKFHFLVNFYPSFNNKNNEGTIIGQQLSFLRNEIIHEFHVHDTEDFNRKIIKLRGMMFLYVYCRKISEILQESINDPLNKSFANLEEKLYNKMQTFNDTFQCSYYVPEDELHFGLEKNGTVVWESGKKDIRNCVLKYIKKNIFLKLFNCGNNTNHKRNTTKGYGLRKNFKYLDEWKSFRAIKGNKSAIYCIINTIKILISLQDKIPNRTILNLYEDYLEKKPQFEESLLKNNLSPNLFEKIPRTTKAIFSYKGVKQENKFICLIDDIMSYFKALYSCTLFFDRLKDALNNKIVLDYLLKLFGGKKILTREQKNTAFALVKTIENWKIAAPFVAKLIFQNEGNLTDWEEVVGTLLTGNNGGYLHHINGLIENMEPEQGKAFVNLIIKIIIQKRMLVKDISPLLENLKTSRLILEILTEKLDCRDKDYIFTCDLSKKIIIWYNVILKNLDPCFDFFCKEIKLEDVVRMIKKWLLPLCKKLVAQDILKKPFYVAEIELTLARLLLNVAERNKKEKDRCTEEVIGILANYRNTLKNKEIDLLRIAILAQTYFQLEEYKDCADTLTSLSVKLKEKALKRFKKIEKKCFFMTSVKELSEIWIQKLNPIYQKYFDKLEILKKMAIAKLRQGLQERSIECINIAVEKYESAFRMTVSENGKDHIKTLQIRYLLAKSYTIKGFFLQTLGNSSLYYYHKALVLGRIVFDHLKLNVGLYHPKMSQCYHVVSHNLLGLCWEFTCRGKTKTAMRLFLDIYASDFSRFIITLKNVIIVHDIDEKKGYCTINEENLSFNQSSNSFWIERFNKFFKDGRNESDSWEIVGKSEKELSTIGTCSVLGVKDKSNFKISILRTNRGRYPDDIKDKHIKSLWDFINNFLEPKDYFY